jgi:hypothetical protein
MGTGKLYAKIADAIQQIHSTRFLPPSAIIMHPRRWGWMLAQVDTTNRPLVISNNGGAFNQPAVLERVASEAIVGTLQGLPVIVDPSVPTNLGAGTNEDRVIIARLQDLYLWEAPEVQRRFDGVLSGNLQVRLQVYEYAAFSAARLPSAVAVMSGTGFTTPAF